ncbi:MAG TPA: class I SAM-dependent methyltransferase [Kofleriaceae bacterium]|nr:class I SAM-dependent methyltransferase [Kofleriaceae bacterium]
MTEAQFWDRLAAKYAAQPVKDVAAFERKKAITRQHLRAASTVVEFGCGTGSLALDMSSHAGEIHAIDVSAEMIRIAERKKADQGATNVTFHTGTLEAVRPRIPSDVDAVWAYSILHLVADRTSMLRTAFELLKPGGVFISSNVCLAETWVPYGAIISVMRWLGKAPRVYRYDRKTIEREIAAAGFVDIVEHDVGGHAMVAFVVATKPGAVATMQDVADNIGDAELRTPLK